MIRNGTSYEKMKNYRLAVDENGSPFVLNSKGSIDFGYITEEMNLTPALTTGHRSQPLTVKVWASRGCKAG